MSGGEADESLRLEERARGGESIAPHGDGGDCRSSSGDLGDGDEREGLGLGLGTGMRKGGSLRLGQAGSTKPTRVGLTSGPRLSANSF
jgi:hypothetical protein